MKNLFLFSFMVFSATAFATNSMPAGVTAAQDAYVRCDGQGILDHVKESLVESKNHPVVVKNTMGLMEAAKKNGCLKGAKPDFKLPASLTYLDVGVTRRYRPEQGRVTFGVTVNLGVKLGKELAQFQLIRYPDAVIFDKLAGVGEIVPEELDDELNYWMGANATNKPAEEGLYLVNVQVKGEAMVKGYVILSDINSSASPVVLSPAIDQTLSGAQPTFKWKSFRSPESLPGEKVRVDLSVRRQEDEGDDLIWLRLKDEKATSFKVGNRADTREYRGVSELAPGKYLLNVSYKEVSYFGEIGLKRTSTTRVPFSIK